MNHANEFLRQNEYGRTQEQGEKKKQFFESWFANRLNGSG
jgi:hypothetical protein